MISNRTIAIIVVCPNQIKLNYLIHHNNKIHSTQVSENRTTNFLIFTSKKKKEDNTFLNSLLFLLIKILYHKIYKNIKSLVKSQLHAVKPARYVVERLLKSSRFVFISLKKWKTVSDTIVSQEEHFISTTMTSMPLYNFSIWHGYNVHFYCGSRFRLMKNRRSFRFQSYIISQRVRYTILC